MSELNPAILSHLIALKSELEPQRDILTFEHLSLDGGKMPDEVRTYADLFRNGQRLAAYLIGQGMKKGDRFAIMLRNHPEFVEAMVATAMTGTVFVPIDPRTMGEKLAFMLNNSESQGLLCADYALAAVDAVRRLCPQLRWVLALDSGEFTNSAIKDFRDVDDIGQVLAATVPSVPMADLDLSDPYQIIYTSGTTGDPKGIVGSIGRFGGTGRMGEIFGYQPDERPYTGLSLTHSNAQATALCPALFAGYRAIFSRRFTKSKLWDVARKYACTSFSMLGGMATGIYSEPARFDDAGNPVRLVISAGMPAAIWVPFEKRFGVRVFEIYGASDGGGMAFKHPNEGPIGSFGKAMAGYEMKILDEDGNECHPGVVGEICCRPASGSPVSVAVEYHGNPEASQKKIRDGWNRSGDMGHSNAEGWLFYDYRKGGGIRRNGDFINPSLVERVVAEDPQIDDVYVYGIEAKSGAPGEKDLIAAVVPVDATKFDVGKLFANCRAALEPNFVPSYVQVVAEIPKTASEKPLERLLLESFSIGGAGIHAES